MNEIDDRLAGDPVWELFPDHASGAAGRSGLARFGRWLGVACLVAACWMLAPPLAILSTCLSIAVGDFRKSAAGSPGRFPISAGGTVYALFTYGWAAWKLGLTSLPFVFAMAFLGAKRSEMPSEFLASLLLFVGGYSLSAAFTAAGLFRAYRSGMRVWVGKGVNQARTLLLGMLIVGFTVAVLGPLCVWLAAGVPHASHGDDSLSMALAAMFALMFVGPVVMRS